MTVPTWTPPEPTAVDFAEWEAAIQCVIDADHADDSEALARAVRGGIDPETSTHPASQLDYRLAKLAATATKRAAKACVEKLGPLPDDDDAHWGFVPCDDDGQPVDPSECHPVLMAAVLTVNAYARGDDDGASVVVASWRLAHGLGGMVDLVVELAGVVDQVESA